MRGPSQTTLNNSAAVQLAATAQAHKMVASRTGSPEIQTSQNGYSGPEEHVGEAATERTGLLGNGDTSAPDAGQNGTKDNWVGFQEFEGLPWYKTPSVYWLLGPYALFSLAFGGAFVPKINLIVDLMCQRYFSDRAAADPTFQFHQIILGGENPQCQNPDVQKQVALFTMALNVTVGVLSALTAPKVGALSDRYGRKRLMVICGLGGIGSEFITVLCARYPEAVHYRWLVAGSVLDGLAGSFTAGSLLSHSYTSDCTPPSRRGIAIGYLHSCLFTGLAFGPLLAGYLVKWTGSLLTIFYVVLGCHLAFLGFVLVVLPESVSRRRQLVAREKHHKEVEAGRSAQGIPGWLASLECMPYGGEVARALNLVIGANPFAPLRVLLPRGPGSSPRLRLNMLVLSSIDVCILGAAMGATTVIILYSELLFGWGTFETSRFVSLVSLVRVFVLVAIFPVINYVFRARPLARQRRESAVPIVDSNAGADPLDLWVLRVALLSDVVGVAGYMVVRTPELFLLSGAVTAVGGLGSATIQAVITKHVPADRVGQVFGAIGQLHALSRVFAPMVFNGIYAATVRSFPQAFFILLVGLFVVSMAGAFAVKPHLFLEESEPSISDLASEPPNGFVADSEDVIVEEEIVPRVGMA